MLIAECLEAPSHTGCHAVTHLTTKLVTELLDPARQPVVGAALEVEALQRVAPVGIKTCIVQTDLQGCKQGAKTCLWYFVPANSDRWPPAPLSIKLVAAESSLSHIASTTAKHCMHGHLHVHVLLPT